MAALSREVLKWLQSLDLSYSIKNVKRDFTNGFLVAEILSRYYGSDIQMHSFDNGSSLPKKLDNWAQLEKFFRRKDIPIAREMIDDVLHNKGNAAVPLVEVMYQFLTGKRIIPLSEVKPQQEEAVPPFARPTASKLIKENIQESELQTTLKSTLSVTNKAQNIIDDQNQSMREERALEPARFASQQRAAAVKVASRVPARTVEREDDDQPGVEFKDVSIRPVEKNISQLRATHDVAASNRTSVHSALSGKSKEQVSMQQSQDLMGTGGSEQINAAASMSMSGGMAGTAGRSGGASGGGAPTKTVTEVMNSSVLTQLGNDAEFRQIQERDAIVSFIDNMTKFSPEAGVAVFGDLTKKAPVLAEICMNTPKEFWKLATYFMRAFNEADTAEVFAAIVAALSTIGSKMAGKDSLAAMGLFIDYVLPKLCPIIKGNRAKREPLLRLMYCFCPENVRARTNMIKVLQESLNDQGAFIHCMTLLCTLENGFDKDLLDLYIYYCEIGIGMPSPFLRAACLSMLPIVAPHGYDIVWSLLQRHTAIVEDTWWEVQAQLLIIASSLLEHYQPTKEDPDQDAFFASLSETIINVILTPRVSPNVYKIGISYLAPFTATYPGLCRIIVGALLEAPQGVRDALLSNEPPEPIQMLSSDARGYHIVSLNQVWDHFAIANTLVEIAKMKSLGNFESSHMGVLAAAIPPAVDGAEGWSTVWSAVRDYVYVGLCDADVCDLAGNVLVDFCQLLGEEVIRTFGVLLNSLRMIFPQNRGTASCKTNVVGVLRRILGLGEPFATAISTMIAKFPEDLVRCNDPTLTEFLEEATANHMN